MTNSFNAVAGSESMLPKRFALLPSSDGSLQVNLAKQCVGSVWPEQEKWLAKDSQGAMLDTGSGCSVFEAVTAVFKAYAS